MFVQAVIDFESCVYDKLYRAVLSVRNRGTTALKCLTTVPPAMRGLLEFVPDMFFLQVSHCDCCDVAILFIMVSGMLCRPRKRAVTTAKRMSL